MTLNEFKAWFEGFTEGMDGPPNEAQWKRIQERLATVTAISIQPQVIGLPLGPAIDPRRTVLGQNLTAAQSVLPAGWGKVTLNAAPPAGNGVGAYAAAVPTERHNHCRPVDVAAELRALGKAEAKAA